MEMKEKQRILFIAGTGRCGSTIIEAALSQLDDVTGVGELRYFWERGIQQDRLTGTGERFSEEPFWQKVVLQVSQREPLNSLRMRHLLCRNERRVDDGFEEEIRALYQAVMDECKSEWIVDSSKLPNFLHRVVNADVADVYVLHVVRDPHGTVTSWQNPKYDKGKGAMMSRKSFFGALLESLLINHWIARDFGTHSHYKKVVYEEFAQNPHSELDAIIEWLDIGSKNPVSKNGELRLGAENPTISGNPIRFDRGVVRIKLDERWRAIMPRWQKAVTAVVLKMADICNVHYK